jgi:hypothetical protein
MSVEAPIPWAESMDVFEIIEAVMNLVDAEHMVHRCKKWWNAGTMFPGNYWSWQKYLGRVLKF